MRSGARLQAAIEVLTDISDRHRPAGAALQDWGRSHRFAGSGDRAAIGNLVYDALRRRASIAWAMDGETPRALALGAAGFGWDIKAEELSSWFRDDKFAPAPLEAAEMKALDSQDLSKAPDWVQADIPEWLFGAFQDNFDDQAIVEGQALAKRPPTDLRVNRLKGKRDKVLKALKRHGPIATKLSPDGIRLNPSARAGRSPNVQVEAGFQRGHFEVQDEGSQIVSQLVFAQAGEQVLDYCAGAGGKTLALAGMMENKGQIYSYDADRNRLARIYDRLKRAGARNVQVRSPDEGALDDLIGQMDRVVVDAPCSGSGVWRRRPDAKWRLTEQALQNRAIEQTAILRDAAAFVKPGGYLCYITCSVLAQENERRISDFLDNAAEFQPISAGEVWQDLFGLNDCKPWSADGCSITLTPASTDTDGFFFAVLHKGRPQ